MSSPNRLLDSVTDRQSSPLSFNTPSRESIGNRVPFPRPELGWHPQEVEALCQS